MRPDPQQRVNGYHALDHDAPTVKLPAVTRRTGGSDGMPPDRPATGTPPRRNGRTVRALSLALCCLVAVLAPLAVLIEGIDPMARLLLGLPLVVLVPGYAIIAATCPGPSVSGAERLALSLGVSLAVTVLGSLFLNLTPWGLQPVSWATLLSLLTLTASAIAIVGRRWLSLDPRTRARHAPATAGLGVGSAIMLAVAACIVVATIGLARASAATRTDEGFTQVWMLPTPEVDASSVRLGVKSHEEQDTQYVLRLEVDGAVLATWPSIALAPGESWEATAAIPDDAGAPVVAEARLYRVGDQAIGDTELDDPAGAYRRVVLRR